MADDKRDDFPRDNLVRAVIGGVDFRDDPQPQDGRLGTLTGQFAVFNEWTEINSMFEGNFLERNAPGAFKKTVAENQAGMRVLFQHGRDPQIGDKPLGPIESLDEKARYKVPLLDTSYNRDLLPGLKAGVYGASYRFQVLKEELRQDPGVSAHNPKGLPERTITEARVMEFGPVTFPAYPGATAGVRSLTDRFRVAEYAREAGIDVERVDAEGLATLAAMIQQGADYIADQDEPDDQKNIPVMENVLKQLSELVQVEAAEEEPDEPDDDETNSSTASGETRSPLTSADAPDNLKPEPAEATPEPPVKDEEPEHSEESRSTPKPDKPQPTSEQKEKTMNEYRSVEEIDARLAEIAETMSEISKEHGIRALPADAKASWDELKDEKARLTADKVDYLERQAYLEGNAPKQDAIEHGAGSAVARAARSKAPDNVFDLTEYHTRSNSQEHMNTLLEDGAKRAVEGFRYPNENVNQEDTSGVVERLLALDGPDKEIAQRLLIHGSPTYRSAFWKKLSGQPLNQEEQRKMAEGMALEARALSTTSTGGVTVPVQIDPTVLLSSTGAINPFRLVSKQVQTTSYQWQAVTSTGITAQYRAEAAAMADNSPTLVAPAINPERADAFVPFSWESGQDWGGLEADMASMFSDAKDVLEATKFASGAGHSSNEPQGVLTGAGTVVGSSATTTVGTVDIYALEAALPVRFQPNAVWLATPALFSRIRLQAALGSNSGGIWADSLQVGQPARLLGYPAYKASSVGTAGNAAVSVASCKWGIFGDFSKFAIVDRIGMQVKYIDTLFNGNTAGGIAYPNGQSGLVLYWRNSSGVLASNAFRTGTIT